MIPVVYFHTPAGAQRCKLEGQAKLTCWSPHLRRSVSISTYTDRAQLGRVRVRVKGQRLSVGQAWATEDFYCGYFRSEGALSLECDVLGQVGFVIDNRGITRWQST